MTHDTPSTTSAPYPLINTLSNKGNNLINGYGNATSNSSIDPSNASNGHGPSPTQEPLPIKEGDASPVEEDNNSDMEDLDAAMTITGSDDPIEQDDIIWMQVSLFDNGAKPKGRIRWNQYVMNVHFTFINNGPKTKWRCAFHNKAAHFWNNIPAGLTTDLMYRAVVLHMQDLVDEHEGEWDIVPTAGKFQDAHNHVVDYTVAVLSKKRGENARIRILIDNYQHEAEITSPGSGKLIGNAMYFHHSIQITPGVVNPLKKSHKTAKQAIR